MLKERNASIWLHSCMTAPSEALPGTSALLGFPFLSTTHLCTALQLCELLQQCTQRSMLPALPMLHLSDQILVIVIKLSHILCGNSPVLIQIAIIIIIVLIPFLLKAGLPWSWDCTALHPCLVIFLDCQPCACTQRDHRHALSPPKGPVRALTRLAS